jgi:hypothetical protein
MDHIHEFMPHGVCISWDVTLLILHVLSDIFIALAYFSIPIGIIYFVRKKDDITFKPVYYLFAGFITACGLTHLMGIVTLWFSAVLPGRRAQSPDGHSFSRHRGLFDTSSLGHGGIT